MSRRPAAAPAAPAPAAATRGPASDAPDCADPDGAGALWLAPPLPPVAAALPEPEPDAPPPALPLAPVLAPVAEAEDEAGAVALFPTKPWPYARVVAPSRAQVRPPKTCSMNVSFCHAAVSSDMGYGVTGMEEAGGGGRRREGTSRRRRRQRQRQSTKGGVADRRDMWRGEGRKEAKGERNALELRWPREV